MVTSVIETRCNCCVIQEEDDEDGSYSKDLTETATGKNKDKDNKIVKFSQQVDFQLLNRQFRALCLCQFQNERYRLI